MDSSDSAMKLNIHWKDMANFRVKRATELAFHIGLAVVFYRIAPWPFNWAVAAVWANVVFWDLNAWYWSERYLHLADLTMTKLDAVIKNGDVK
jgi:hypothetical protein